MTPLSQLLRESSRPEHTEAETRPFITRLMGGELTVPDYAAYLANLAPIYRALEARTHMGTPRPGTEDLWNDGLDRVASIEHDLRELGVSDNGADLVTTEAKAYADYLEALSGRDDLRLVAHHYTRYLGDLSGGQAIGALVARHYGLTPNQLTFCEFPQIDNIVRFKEAYRETLDGILASEAERDELVAEVKAAFGYNQAIFEALGRSISVV